MLRDESLEGFLEKAADLFLEHLGAAARTFQSRISSKFALF